MPALGDIMYEEGTGDSGNVTSDDRVIIGNPFPKMSYSFNLGFSVERIDQYVLAGSCRYISLQLVAGCVWWQLYDHGMTR